MGAFENQWNLHVNACIACNNQKGELEADIGALTLHRLLQSGLEKDQNVINDALRKINGAHSRHAGKPVKDSHTEHTIGGRLMDAISISFTMNGPPQISEERAFTLAYLQLQGFFYLSTYREAERSGRFMPGRFRPIMTASINDWGNAVFRSFADTVLAWETRTYACGASTYFKLVVRRQPKRDCWSWAIEWNKAFRLIGLYGDEAETKIVIDALPKLKKRVIPIAPGREWRMREEIRLHQTMIAYLPYRTIG